MKVLFIFILFVWCCLGTFGVLRCKEERPNYEMLLFLIIVPLIPLIAHFCKII